METQDLDRLLASYFGPLKDSVEANKVEHKEIHGGDAFTYDDVVTGAAAFDYLLTVPNTTLWPNLGYDIESGGAGYTLELFEASDKTGTTGQTLVNRNRNSATAATMTIHKGTSGGSTDGTRIMWRVSGTTTAGGKIGGSSKDGTERILKQATKYILRITPLASNTTSVRINWYEHINA